jgi:hypothetical protein
MKKKLYLKIFLFIASVDDTADKHSFANISVLWHSIIIVLLHTDLCSLRIDSLYVDLIKV